METGAKSKRWRRLERWQVLLAAVVAAVASVIVALINIVPNDHGGSGPPPPPQLAITGLSVQPASPPPAARYTWSGTESNLESILGRTASIFVVGKPSSNNAAAVQQATSGASWLVSPQAKISANGSWTVTWIILQPPSAVTWTAVEAIQGEQAGACPGPSGVPVPCPSQSDDPFGLRSQGPNSSSVVAKATYHPG